MSGLQPFCGVGLRTQPVGLGCDVAAPLALNKTMPKLHYAKTTSYFATYQTFIGRYRLAMWNVGSPLLVDGGFEAFDGFFVPGVGVFAPGLAAFFEEIGEVGAAEALLAGEVGEALGGAV